MRDMIAQIGAMAISSVQNIGISSEPIRTLIEKYFDFDKMAASDKKYIVVVTETPTMVEKDIEIVKMPRNEWVDWMVASGSFFPVMQATKIRDTYYIDGGYRNNLPIDQVLINGANTVLAVDVKGPGMKKSYPNQADTSIWEVSTPWNLGTVLIFDSNRSSLNVKLGYIETKRYFGLTEGYWYTFNDSDIDLKMRNLWNAFNQYLKTNYNQEILPDSRFEEGFFAKLSAEHKAPIYRENAPLAMLEALARYANMMPIREFEVDDFISLVNEQMEQIQLEIGDALISISEWFLIYYKQFFILSNTSQFSRVRSLLEVEEEEKVRRVQFLWNKLPLPLMLVLFFDFLSDYDVQ
jgi:NTE family protein